MGKSLRKKIKKVIDFDEQYVVRFHGYENVNDYYKRTSVCIRLHKIEVPTLFLSPIDDPIVPRDSLPIDAAKENQYIFLATHPCAGHCGFFTGIRPRPWHQIPVAEFLSAVHNQAQSKNHAAIVQKLSLIHI
eukprot:TRINITY_DN13128_c0_g1_i1.p2 TRINITY_DN13128_c0_g1~~TRINITY_DN13128_c0_g1_i1.p2  ORF type:complete len:132 (+),score=11.01 TRINITY_DN13128_c0_g1_i1:190-585(+)